MLTSSLQFRQKVYSERTVSVPQKSIFRSKAYGSLIFLLSDSVSIITAFFLTYYLFSFSDFTLVPSVISFKILVVSGVCFMLSNYFIGLYPGYGIDSVDELRSLFYGTALVIFLIVIFCGFQNDLTVSIALFQLAFSFVLYTSAVANRRYLRKLLVNTNWWGIPAVLYGSSNDVKLMLEALICQKEIGLKPRVFIESDEISKSYNGDESDIAPLLYIADKTNIDHLVIALSDSNKKFIRENIYKLTGKIAKITLVPDTTAIKSLWLSTRNLNDLINDNKSKLTSKNLILKNVFDKIFSIVFMLLTAPLFALCSIVIFLENKGCVFFKSIRIGKDNRAFNILKFRTMIDDAENILNEILHKNPDLKKEYYKYHKLSKDPRVTKFGKFLRRFYIDEIPQFLNVLFGDMSLIGSRPYFRKEIDKMGDINSIILQMRPGLTGLWQVTDSYTATFERRTLIDIYYIRNWTFFLDIFIIARTISWVLKGNGK